MIAFKLDYHGKVFGFTEDEDQHFFRMYLSYLSQLKHDDMHHWSAEEVAFYNKVSFPIGKDTSRERIYLKLVQLFHSSKSLPESVRTLLDGGFPEFNDWYSAIQSRTFSIEDQ